MPRPARVVDALVRRGYDPRPWIRCRRRSPELDAPAAVFTAINTWSEAIVDADEMRFLAAHVEVARRP